LLALAEAFSEHNRFKIHFSKKHITTCNMIKSIYSRSILLLAIMLIARQGFSQGSADVFEKAQALKAAFKYKDALPYYQALLKADSANVGYLANGSQVYTRYGYLYMTSETEKQRYFHIAEYLAKKAIAKDDKDAEAHYAYALALGRINENASSKQKIANAKLIKKEVDRSIELNPKQAGAYHILGRWHATIAGFNAVEKAMINTFFGGVPPGGSYEDAIKAFQTAISLEPKNMIHQYEIANTYYAMGNKIYAKVWLDKALALPVISDDDKITQGKCNDLKSKLE
jgi:tetratricopeptide (TPR) repeat protein